MNGEITSYSPSLAESINQRIYSSHPVLNQNLSGLDRRINNNGLEPIGMRRAIEMLGFDIGDSELYREVKLIIKTAHDLEMFKSDLREGLHGRLTFDRNTLLLTFVIIQLKGQRIPWPNVPYVAHHYIEDSDIRGEIARPKKHYDEKKSLQDKESICIASFRNWAGNLLMQPNVFDLSKENILSDISGDFLPPQEYSFEDRRSLPVTLQQEMLTVVSSLAKSCPMDPVSGCLLQGTEFDLRDIHTAVAHFERLKGQINPSYIEITDYDWRQTARILEVLVSQPQDIIVDKKSES